MMDSTKPHLLIVDDNKDILTLLQSMLTPRQFRVSVKTSLTDPILSIELIKPDAILLDMHLGGTDGCEICRQIKSSPAVSHIPVIMITAYAEGKQACLDAGAADFIEKPFNMQQMLSTIGKVIDQPAPD